MNKQVKERIINEGKNAFSRRSDKNPYLPSEKKEHAAWFIGWSMALKDEFIPEDERKEFA